MGSIASGIFGLMSGDPAAAQEGQLSDLSGFETGIGKEGTTAAMNYDLGILSGDPTKQAQTLAPEISAQQQQIQQAAKTGAEFGTRSGGTTASTASAEGAGRGNIINLLGSEQSGAASSAGSLGTSNLGAASGNINSVAGLKTAQEARQQADVGGIAQGAAQIATMGMGEGLTDAMPGTAGAGGATTPASALDTMENSTAGTYTPDNNWGGWGS